MPFADEKGARFSAGKGQKSTLKHWMVHDMSGKLIDDEGEVRELTSKDFKNNEATPRGKPRGIGPIFLIITRQAAGN
jgi:hypothetical protein